ncbi:hypothetical protein ALT785_770096 [Alteromonas infernus]
MNRILIIRLSKMLQAIRTQNDIIIPQMKITLHILIKRFALILTTAESQAKLLKNINTLNNALNFASESGLVRS